VQSTVRTPLGNITSSRPCPDCNGQGTIVETPCTTCQGSGHVRRKRVINVKIPAGIDNGQVLTMQGEGEAGVRGGPAGDLYMNVTVRPHEFFLRDGYDIHFELPITFVQAALGDTVQVPTLEGDVDLHIPEGTQPNTNFRMEGRGIQRLNSKRKGDMFVKVRLEVPQKLNAKQKELLQQFDQETSGKQVRDRKNFRGFGRR
jgi:molecular chaperone DnaJ